MFKTYFYFLFLFSSILYSLEPTITTEFYGADEMAPYEIQSMRAEGQCLTIIALNNWPANSIIDMEIKKKLTLPAKEKGQLHINENGMGITVVESIGYIPGEPVTYEYITKDKLLRKSITFCPNRNWQKKLDGSSVTAEIMILNPYTAKILFTGFECGEEYIYRLKSGDEKVEFKQKYDPKNLLTCMPINKEKGGIAELEIERCKNGEKYQLSLPWGLENVKYALYRDEKGKVCSIIENSDALKMVPEVAEYFAKKKSKIAVNE